MKIGLYSGKVYKIGQKQHSAATNRVDEWTGAGAGVGGAVVVGSNPAQSMNCFFFFLVTGTLSAKFPVPVPVL